MYLRQEGRGIGLLEKLKAYNLQDLGHDTVAANLLLGHPADARLYSVASAILEDLGVERVRLLTNNPDKIGQIETSGRVRVVSRVAMVPRKWQSLREMDVVADLEERERSSAVEVNELDRYLKTKVERMGHLIEIPKGLM